MDEKLSISVIVPFYKGNQYLRRLFSSIESVQKEVYDLANLEVILVNDSPEIDPIIPSSVLNVYVEKNERNMGIHASRVIGTKKATGTWIIFLDQDDELQPKGFREQIKLTYGTDVVVGNGIYQYGNQTPLIYKNKVVMDYLIQKERFIQIRNMIPSPGACLLRKKALPRDWMQMRLRHNGSDDWMLWLLLFADKRKFACNSGEVYIHNDAGGTNLSLDLDKMYESSLEMVKLLKQTKLFTKKEIVTLERAVEFKYFQDTRKLDLAKALHYIDVICHNMFYKVSTAVMTRIKA